MPASHDSAPDIATPHALSSTAGQGRALVTGFAPWDVWPLNASWEAVSRMAAGIAQPGVEIRQLPVDHVAAAHALRQALDAVQPQIVLMCGQSREPSFRLELIARRPDPADWPDGAPSHRGVWPWETSAARIRSAGSPARMSDDCGRFVCESSYWSLLAHRAETRMPRLAAFLHMPPLDDNWPVKRLAAGVAAALGVALENHAAREMVA